MKARSPARPAVVAALAIVWIACLVLLLMPSGPTGQRVIAQFAFAGGLIEGAPVTLAGVPVGRVDEIRLGPRDQPEVVLRMHDDVVLRQGATADLRIQSQAGQLNRQIEITEGSGDPLADGAVIPRARTQTPVELDDVFSTLDPKTRANVRSVAGALDLTLRRSGPDLGATIEATAENIGAIEGLAAVLADDGPVISRLVAESNTIASAAARDSDSIAGAADRLAATLRVAAARQQELRAGTEQLAPTLRAGTEALESTRASLPSVRAALLAAKPAARQARTSAPVFASALQAAPEAMAATEQLAAQAPAQLKAIRPMIKASTPVMKGLPDALRQFLPFADELRARAPDALSWLVLIGEAMANYDENGHGIRMMAILTPTPQNIVSGDKQEPGLLPVPFERRPGVLVNEPWNDFREAMLSPEAREENP